MRLLFTQPRGSTPTPGILLDRDGVINYQIPGGYVTDWARFRFVRGIKRVLAQLSRMGFPLIVVSNQAGVGKGLISSEALAEISRRFAESLGSSGARINAVYYCTHLQEKGCDCRKPKSGLLQQAARDWHLDLSRCVMIGDSTGDIEAARRVNCRSILLTRSRGGVSAMVQPGGSAIARTPAELPALVHSLIGMRQKRIQETRSGGRSPANCPERNEPARDSWDEIRRRPAGLCRRSAARRQPEHGIG